ncbi:MAG TPA: vitamin K epoxide reductase family protein [bacterium]|nr:vitamin K epoxide reductase family protein [bacterium]
MPTVDAAPARRWMAMTALALAGFADALYLTGYHYNPAVRACVGSGGCEAVNGSRFATLAGVPVALIGTAGYVLILAALTARRWGPPHGRRAAGYAAYVLAAAGTAFSLYLTALEAFVLHAYCTWCLFSAAVITAVCVVATIDLAAGSP